MSRIEPDKESYGRSMAQFFHNLIPDQPRSPATSKIALTTAASRTYTREYGVEFNILITKLYGHERTTFGFDAMPDRRHFALKIYGNVYEFGPYPEMVRKSLASDWCTDHPHNEFASVLETNFLPLTPVSYRRAITAYTMRSEDEFDEVVQRYLNHCVGLHMEYHPEKLSCFSFIKFAVMELVPEALPEDEMELWLAKWCVTMMNPEMRKTVRRMRRKMHHYAGVYGTGKVLEEIKLDIDENKDQVTSRRKRKSTPIRRPRSNRKTSPSPSRWPSSSSNNPKMFRVHQETYMCRDVLEIDLTFSDDEH